MPPKGKVNKAPSIVGLEGTDVQIQKENFRIGARIGAGGFGLIYLAGVGGQTLTAATAPYVAKVELEESGGLFSEMKSLQNTDLVAWKQAGFQAWKSSHSVRHVGLPFMHACGTFQFNGKNLRVMILDRLGTSLDASLQDAQMSCESAAQIALQLITALEYTHDHGYVHADIKSQNICFGLKDASAVHLIDFGIAVQYLSDVSQPANAMKYLENPKKAHDGTLAYTSSDAHRGVQGSRRGDFEILVYVLLDWIGRLPWSDECKRCPDQLRNALAPKIMAQKSAFYRPGSGGKGMDAATATAAAGKLLAAAYHGPDSPLTKSFQVFISEVFQMPYGTRPPYDRLRDILTKALKAAGAPVSGQLKLQSSSSAKVPRSPTLKKKTSSQPVLPSAPALPAQSAELKKPSSKSTAKKASPASVAALESKAPVKRSASERDADEDEEQAPKAKLTKRVAKASTPVAPAPAPTASATTAKPSAVKPPARRARAAKKV
eukprot:m.283363 g.283363  ORF g.283363 m.283363 type:complete len:490 (-) comp54945_c0_seq1:736-2205(-)